MHGEKYILGLWLHRRESWPLSHYLCLLFMRVELRQPCGPSQRLICEQCWHQSYKVSGEAGLPALGELLPRSLGRFRPMHLQDERGFRRYSLVVASVTPPQLREARIIRSTPGSYAFAPK